MSISKPRNILFVSNFMEKVFYILEQYKDPEYVDESGTNGFWDLAKEIVGQLDDKAQDDMYILLKDTFLHKTVLFEQFEGYFLNIIIEGLDRYDDKLRAKNKKLVFTQERLEMVGEENWVGIQSLEEEGYKPDFVYEIEFVQFEVLDSFEEEEFEWRELDRRMKEYIAKNIDLCYLPTIEYL